MTRGHRLGNSGFCVRERGLLWSAGAELPPSKAQALLEHSKNPASPGALPLAAGPRALFQKTTSSVPPALI